MIRRSHKQFLAQLGRRMGIWDVRFALRDAEMHWEMPGRVEVDPDTYLCDVRGLFAEQTSKSGTMCVAC